MQRLAVLTEEIAIWRRLEGDVQALTELASQDGDEELVENLGVEVESIVTRLASLEVQLLFGGPYDSWDAILAVHAGAGGTESQDWAQMLLRMYLRWAEKRKFSAQVLDTSQGEEAGVKSALVEVRGENALGWLKAERGVHRLVRLSPFDSAHLRHTSFALVEVWPLVEEEEETPINADELRIDTFRASGHGGQNVQKLETAVRITHLPTGVVVTCQNERSQGQNRETAMKVLRARLLNLELQRRAEEQARLKGEHITPGWGHQIRSYVLHPYKIVKDHRTNYETQDPQAVLDGDLDDLLKAYLQNTVGDTGLV
jgi:peptide chain release factor 2